MLDKIPANKAYVQMARMKSIFLVIDQTVPMNLKAHLKAYALILGHLLALNIDRKLSVLVLFIALFVNNHSIYLLRRLKISWLILVQGAAAPAHRQRMLSIF